MQTPRHRHLQRTAAAIVALVTWAGLDIQLSASFSKADAFLPALWGMARFFTIISNLLVALLFSGIVLGSRRFARPFWMGGAAVIMLLVAIVFAILLSGLQHLSGAAAVADFILHKVVPILVLLYWIAFVPKGGLRWRDPLLWAVLPLAYLPYALTRGVIDGIYPYPFLNVAKLGLAQVGLNVLAITIGFLLAGSALVSVDARWNRIKNQS